MGRETEKMIFAYSVPTVLLFVLFGALAGFDVIALAFGIGITITVLIWLWIKFVDELFDNIDNKKKKHGI